ncbi:MAG: adenylosuccinate lyase [Rickettsiales bacterium]|nr:adenylosuccinate lyase [Rickettsiales bacterium]
MIPRYSRKDLKEIWEPNNKFRIWLEIEILACEAQYKLGNIPLKSLKIIKKKAKFQIDRIHQIEKEVKHDVIAFLTNLSENIGDDSRYIHLGLTSSDILDTCLAVQISQSCIIIKKEFKLLLNAIKKQSIKHKKTMCIGRSHGIFAEPTTFGLKLLSKYCEFKRGFKRFNDAEKDVCVGAISGAIGTFANVDPYVEKYVMKKLKLGRESVSTQIIPRDRHANFFSTVSLIASSIENLATEIRHLQRSEVREVEEFFSKDQKGSSAMPHKRNPVLSENLTGISRIIRSSVIPFLENISLWHERDISHSSVERILCPDVLVLIDFSLNRLRNIIENIVVNKKQMIKNLDKTKYLYNSQRVMLALIQSGLTREKSYKIVQKIAMDAWNNDKNFKDLLKNNKEIKNYLSDKIIHKIFDIEYHFKHIEKIYKNVLG